MARNKDYITQNDFSLGSTRPEAAERDDTGLVANSMRECVNTIGLTTGAMSVRDGTLELGVTDADKGFEIDLGSDRIFDLHIVPDGVVVYGSEGEIITSFLSNTWINISNKFGSRAFGDVKFWVLSDPDTASVLIGAQDFPIQALVRNSDGTWDFGGFEFAVGLSGVISQPYWSYVKGLTILPSARTGAITVTSSEGIFSAAWVGLRIRYVDQEIVFTGYNSATEMAATATEELPPTYDCVVTSVSGYELGDAVEHETLGGQGIITAIDAGTKAITVLMTAFWDGMDTGQDLVAANASQNITSFTTVSPAATFLWDMQMLNNIYGYAGHAESHKSRIYLCDFPTAAKGFAVSQAGTVDDFMPGTEDNSAFVEAISGGGSLKFISSAEDLLFLTTRGLYYQQTRDGSDVTFDTIGPVSFSEMGCADIRPVRLEDGVVFVDAASEQVYTATLAGDVYRSWRAEQIAKYHNHLFNQPVFLGATQYGSDRPEHFVYVVNNDGTAAVGQWDRDAAQVGWRPWETDGEYKAIYQVFNKIQSITQRTINSVTSNYRERFESGVYLDCSSCLNLVGGNDTGADQNFFGGKTSFATHLTDDVAAVYFEGWDYGDLSINVSGVALDASGDVETYEDYDGVLQVGLPFTMKLVPWDRRSINTRRGARDVKRVIKMFFTVQDTSNFEFDGVKFGGYRVNEPLNVPPPKRTEEVSFVTVGNQFYAARELVKDRPGPFKLLRQRYKVSF